LGYSQEKTFKARSSPPVLGRKVSASKEGFSFGSEEYCKRPTTRAREGYDHLLITPVNIRSFVPVHLYGDKVFVYDLCDLFVFKAFVCHHMTPMAPYTPNRKKDGFVFLFGFFEGGFRPLVPIYRLMGGFSKIGTSCVF